MQGTHSGDTEKLEWGREEWGRSHKTGFELNIDEQRKKEERSKLEKAVSSKGA